MSVESLREQVVEVLAANGVSYPICGDDGWCDCLSDLVGDLLAVLGEVTVTEEWGVHGVDGLDRVWVAREEEARAHASVDIPWARRPRKLVRRTVVTTRRVGEWEEVQ